MGSTPFTTYDVTQRVMPVQDPGDARQDAVAWGASLTIVAGDIIAVKTSDSLCYRFATGGAGGLAVPVGIAIYSFITNAAGKVYFGGEPAVSSFMAGGPWSTAPIWRDGIFDPTDLKEGGVARTAAQVETAFGDLCRILHNGFVKID